MKILKIIPFRLQSNRFPNKALSKYFGMTLIENALHISNKISFGETLITCSVEDYNITKSYLNKYKDKFDFLSTKSTCNSATERIIEIFEKKQADIYVSIPIDEGALSPHELERVITEIQYEEFEAYTLYCDFYNLEDAYDNLSAKIVTDLEDNILYMSRSAIPIAKNGKVEKSMMKKHVGVFLFRRKFLQALYEARSKKTVLDKYEGLEQLRLLELGFSIKTKKSLLD